MNSKTFMEIARNLVVDYYNERRDISDSVEMRIDNTYVVWFCKTLQNWKALVSTVMSDGMYYEVTYNGDKHEAYLDVYKKWENKVIKDEQTDV